MFEPLAPPFISLYLRRRMERWRKEGLFVDYEVKTKRMKKFHYKVDIDLDLTQEQFGNVFSKTLEKMSNPNSNMLLLCHSHIHLKVSTIFPGNMGSIKKRKLWRSMIVLS